MHWTRLDPKGVIGHLSCNLTTPEYETLAELALTHVSEELLSGRYIAVQDHQGSVFIGTPEEAAEHMLARSDA